MSAFRTMLMLPVATMVATCAAAQQVTLDPYPTPINTTEGVIAVNYREFAAIPDINGEAARADALRRRAGHQAPVRQRHDRGALQHQLRRQDRDAVSRHQRREVGQSASSRKAAERGFQSFAFHPQFSQAGTPGYGKFYTYVDTSNMTPTAGLHAARQRPHARHGPAGVDGQGSDGRRPTTAARRASCSASRIRSPTTTADRSRSTRWPRPGTPDFGLLYIGFADGGSGGDPYNHAQNLKLGLRQDPAHRSARQEQRQRQVRHSRDATRS